MFLPTKFNKKKNRGGVYLLNNSIFIVLFVAYFINMLYLLVSFIQQLAPFPFNNLCKIIEKVLTFYTIVNFCLHTFFALWFNFSR